MERMDSPDGPGAAAMKEALSALANLPPEQRRMMEKMMADPPHNLRASSPWRARRPSAATSR